MASEHSAATPAVIARDFLPLAIVSVPMAGLIAGLIYLVRRGEEVNSAWQLAALFTLFLVLVSGLGLWSWLSCIRWPRRLAAVVVGIAVLQHSAYAGAGDGMPEIFGLFVLAPAMASYAVVVAALHRTRFRMKLAPARFTGGSLPSSATGPVFSIADMLLWALAAALLCAVARSMPAEVEEFGLLRRPDGEIVVMMWMSVSCCIVSLIALWAVFGASRLVIRLIALFIGAPLAVWLVTGLAARYFFGAAAWLVPIEVVPFVWVQSVIVAIVLWVYRACGYRLIRVASVLESVPPQRVVPVPRPFAAPAIDLNHSPIGS